VSKAFLFAVPVGILMGVSNTINVSTISHLYFYFMPVLMMSFGYHINKLSEDKFTYFTYKYSSFIFKMLIFFAVMYPAIHFFGYWEYFGYSSGLLITYSLMRTKSSQNFIIGFVLDLLSGKRTPIVVWIFLFLKSNFLFTLLLILIVSLSSLSLISAIPERYINVLDVDIFDLQSLYLATGGRSAEWSAIYDLNSTNIYRWLFGNGFGVKYEAADDYFGGGGDIRHYSHLMPLSFILITGIISSLFIYLTLSFHIFNEVLNKNIYADFLLIVLLYSLAGASLHVEPIPWIIIGASFYSNSRFK
jgi:hypothetical protein